MFYDVSAFVNMSCVAYQAGPRILLALQTWGVVNSVTVVTARPPNGLWEYILTWFGYTFEEVRITHLFCVIPFLVYCMSLCMLLTLSYRLLWYAAHLLSAIMLTWFSFIKARISSVASDVADIFRVPASTIAPDRKQVALTQDPDFGVVMESVRPNSPFTVFAATPSQVSLGKHSEEMFTAVGCGVRVRIPYNDESYIVVPRHVFDVLDDCVSMVGKGGTIDFSKSRIDLDGKTLDRPVLDIDTDVVAFRVTDRECSTVGASVAKVHVGLDVDSSAYCQVVGPKGLGSCAMVKPDNSLFGGYVYTGSTVGGTSGAAYMVCGSVLAIHLAGGNVNIGYSLRLAYVTLLHQRNQKPEDSDEWIKQMVKSGKRIFVDQNYGHSDDVRIRTKGKYHIVSRTALAALANVPETEVSGGWVQYQRSWRKDLSEPESANPNSPTTLAGPTRSSTKEGPLDQLTPRDETAERLQKLEKCLKEQTQRSDNLAKNLKAVTAGRTKVAVPSPASGSS